MAKSNPAAAPAAPTATQEEATRPRPIDATGRVLDDWGLPLAGPARVRALAVLGRTDPAVDPTGWTETAEPPLEVMTVDVPADAPAEADSLAAAPPADPTPQMETQ